MTPEKNDTEHFETATAANVRLAGNDAFMGSPRSVVKLLDRLIDNAQFGNFIKNSR